MTQLAQSRILSRSGEHLRESSHPSNPPTSASTPPSPPTHTLTDRPAGYTSLALARTHGDCGVIARRGTNGGGFTLGTALPGVEIICPHRSKNQSRLTAGTNGRTTAVIFPQRNSRTELPRIQEIHLPSPLSKSPSPAYRRVSHESRSRSRLTT